MSHIRHNRRGIDYSCFKRNDQGQEAAEMNTEQKRQWLMALYPESKTWSDKVKNMPEGQVIAIYLKKVSRPQRKAS